MKRFFLQKGNFKVLIALLFAATLFVGVANKAMSVEMPSIPVLSLTGTEAGYETSLYPDGRIWVPPSLRNENPREFLVPVFINNKWFTYDQSPQYVADPIYSFEFTMLYDSTAVLPVDVQTFGPLDGAYGDPLKHAFAYNFQLSWKDYSDKRYMKFLNPIHPDSVKGRGIRITGISSKPLPNTDPYGNDYKVLLYIRFKVVPTTTTGSSFSANAPLIIDNRVIKYNDLNVCVEAPFKAMRKYDPLVESDYPDPGDPLTGLAGINNNSNGLQWTVEPTYPGVIYVRIMDNLPKFFFAIERGVGSNPPMETDNSGEVWNIIDPLTIDENSIDRQYGMRTVKVKDEVSNTRLQDVHITTDAPWLEFRAGKGRADTQPWGRNQVIDYIDEGILGGGNVDPYGTNTVDDGDVFLDIRTDPTKLSPNNTGEKSGVYVGYVTLSSSFAQINPVKLRVTFVYFRNPLEGGQNRKKGIELVIRNSNGAVGEQTNLIFGTGNRATDKADYLFAEKEYEYAQSGFGARWYPRDAAGNDIYPFGLEDMAPYDDAITKRSASRDIRSNENNTTSIIYYCKFSAGGDQNYPVYIQWDISDFIPGSRLFLKDAVNGTGFNVDMRSATPGGGTTFYYTIQDPKWTSFVIEYTLPSVIEYVETDGTPIIKHGWNLLSLPIRPADLYYKSVYPNAMSKPEAFYLSDYQVEEDLIPGRGYFIKYPTTIVDTRFAGSYLGKIAQSVGDNVRLYTGWNTIGGLTLPVSINRIDFDMFQSSVPDRNEMLKKGVFGYKTDAGYYEVTEITPGKGYWININDEGYLNLTAVPKLGDEVNGFVLNKEQIYSRSAKLTVQDNAQHNGELFMSSDKRIDLSSFELPPAPPKELFDLRFVDNSKLTNEDTKVFRLQGVSYPVVINVNNADADYSFIDAVTGKHLGNIAKNESGNVNIENTAGNVIKVVKTNVSAGGFVFENYPNPVNSVSTVNYTVKDNSFVSLKLYDALGNVVKTLVSSNQNAGPYTVTLDANDLVSGGYLLKLNTGNISDVIKITVAK